MPAVIDGTGTSTFPAVDGVTMLEGSTAMPRMVLSTAQNTTSGTSIDFTSIPSWVKRITVMFNGVSTNGTGNLLIQLGSGSVDSAGYNSSGATAGATITSVSATNGFILTQVVVATDTVGGLITFSTLGGNIWAESGSLFRGTSAGVHLSSGYKTLSGTLDRIRLTTVGGTDTFDAGSVNILYEG